MVFIFSAASFRDFTEIVSVRSINVLGGSKDEYRVWLHLSQQIHRALNIRTKAIRGVGGILTQLGSEVDYDFVIPGLRRIERAEHIEM